MKRSIVFICFLMPTFFFSCAEQGPMDLEAWQKQLKEKKTALRELQKEINLAQFKVDSLNNKPKEIKKTLVTATDVERKSFSKYVNVLASVVSDDLAYASSETGGRILDLKVKEGEYVKRDQLIATVDLESINKGMDEIQKSLELATTLYEKQKRLWDQGIGTEVQFLQAKNNKERIEQSIKTMQYNLTKSNVYAPLDGVVDRVFLKTGEMAGPGSPIIQIMNTYNVKVVADVPENYLSKVRRGQRVKVNFPTINRQISSNVSEIGRGIDPSNRTFKVEVNATNSSGFLKPNLLAEMLFVDYSIKDAVVVPQDIIQQEIGGKDYIFISSVDSIGNILARKVYVETGESYQGETIVTSGLEGGEQIILEGSLDLTDTELIDIVPSTDSNER